MTTNIGAHLIQEKFATLTDDNVETILEDTKRDVFELLKQSVRPEFLNRVDETIMFRPLTKSDIRKIVDIQFLQIRERIEQNGIKIEISEKVLDHLAKAGFDPQFGARPLKRVIQREILNKLSKEIISGNLSTDALIGINLNENKEVEFINLNEVEI